MIETKHSHKGTKLVVANCKLQIAGITGPCALRAANYAVKKEITFCHVNFYFKTPFSINAKIKVGFWEIILDFDHQEITLMQSWIVFTIDISEINFIKFERTQKLITLKPKKTRKKLSYTNRLILFPFINRRNLVIHYQSRRALVNNISLNHHSFT